MPYRTNAGASAPSGIPAPEQFVLVVLAAVEDTENDHRLFLDGERYGDAMPKSDDSQAWPQIVPRGSAVREGAQVMAVIDNRVREMLRDGGRGCALDVSENRYKLPFGFRGEDKAIRPGHLAFVARPYSMDRVARTSSSERPRTGSFFIAS